MKTFEKFLKILFSFFSFYFLIFSCFALSNEEIYKHALSKFSADMPGFEEVLSSSTEGAPFELEAALFASKQMKQKILGFSLNIEFFSNGIQKNFGCLNNQIFELRSTEFDVVTKDFVFECKLCRVSQNFSKIEQFKKERKILLFFKKLKHDLEQDLIEADLSFKYRKRGEKNRYSVLTIRGKLTNYKPVSFTSNWVTKDSIKDCIKQWTKIIDILANRSLLVMFKSRITQVLVDKLTEEGFEYKDYINYQVCFLGKTLGCLTYKFDMFSFLCNGFSKLRICSV